MKRTTASSDGKAGTATECSDDGLYVGARRHSKGRRCDVAKPANDSEGDWRSPLYFLSLFFYVILCSFVNFMGRGCGVMGFGKDGFPVMGIVAKVGCIWVCHFGRGC